MLHLGKDVDLSANGANEAVFGVRAGAGVQNCAASVVTKVIVVIDTVNMIAEDTCATAVTEVITVYVHVSEGTACSGATLGADGGRRAGSLTKIVGKSRGALVVVSRRTDRIGALRVVTVKLVHTL